MCSLEMLLPALLCTACSASGSFYASLFEYEGTVLHGQMPTSCVMRYRTSRPPALITSSKAFKVPARLEAQPQGDMLVLEVSTP